MDFGDALRELLDCIYEYHDGDFHKVITALKNGTLGGKKYNDKQIAEMRQTKIFRERYGKYLRKIIRAFQTIVMRLEEWKIKFKVRSSSDSGPPARGRLDHKTQQPLFTQDTHSAIENCKKRQSFSQIRFQSKTCIVRSNHTQNQAINCRNGSLTEGNPNWSHGTATWPISVMGAQMKNSRTT